MIAHQVMLGIALHIGLASAALAGEPSLVLVLQADDSARTQLIADGFKASFKGASKMTYQLDDTDDAAAFVADGLRGIEFGAVFAIGDRAAGAAAREFAGVPLIYTDVSNPAVVSSRPDAVKVPLRVNPEEALEKIHILMPQVRQIGMIRATRDRDDEYWTMMQSAAESQGIQLIVGEAASSESINQVLTKTLLSVDAFLLVPGALWTPDTESRLLTTATRAKQPVLGCRSSQLKAPQPASLVLEGDPTSQGQTAATMLQEMLDGKVVSTAYPTPRIIANLSTLRANGVMVSKKTAVVVDEWVDRKSGRQ